MKEIICLLDRSSSMSAVSIEATSGINEFIAEQRTLGEINLNLYWFADTMEVGYEGPIAKITPIERWHYGGMTALYDAIGKTFSHVSKRFSKEKPEKVILAILTDGFENSSKEFTATMCANLIKEHQDKYNWDVIFLAADQDAWDVAQHLNIRRDNAVNYASANTYGGVMGMSATVSKSRKGQ